MEHHPANKCTTDRHNSRDVFLKHWTQFKPLGTKQYVLYNSIYVNLKNRQNYSVGLKIRTAVTCESAEVGVTYRTFY